MIFNDPDSQFAIRNSQFAIRNSQFAIRNSQSALVGLRALGGLCGEILPPQSPPLFPARTIMDGPASRPV
jgi:hypothetical protein